MNLGKTDRVLQEVHMTESVFPSKTGALTASLGNVSLHSFYNPVKEAERYVDSLEIKNGIHYFILLEPALSYTIPVLRKKNPNAFIMALRCSSFFEGRGKPDAEWSNSRGGTLQTFLENHINDADISRIKIIEWRPSLDAYGKKYMSLLKEVCVFMKRGSANVVTAKAFGKRWMQNCFKNLKALKKVLTFTPGNCPVLVCGAGPCLEEAVPLIKQLEQKGTLFIIAVSSAFLALKERGIIPHIVIGSDGGNWAGFHFIECERSSLQNHFICAPLNASLPSQCCEHPVLVLGDGSLWQAALLEKLSIPHLRFPQRGTVTAAALDIAFTLGGGNVFVSGIDLREDDLCSHARPYTFDKLMSAKSTRFCPFYSEMFKRKARENSNALDIYADWFYQYIEQHRGNIFSLGRNHPLFPSLSNEEIDLMLSHDYRFPEFSVTALHKQKESSLEILFHVIDSDETGTLVKKELLDMIPLDDVNEDVNLVLKQKLADLCKTDN